MKRTSLGRIARVTGILSAVGAVAGAIVGAALGVLVQFSKGEFGISMNMVYAGAAFGAGMGMVMAPLAAWPLMRRVPIWRAIAETAAGTVIGAAISMIVDPLMHTVWLSPLSLGIAGFALAAIRLRLRDGAVERGVEVGAD